MMSISKQKRTNLGLTAAVFMLSISGLCMAQTTPLNVTNTKIIDLFADNTGFEGIQNVPVPRPSGDGYTTFDLPLQSLGGNSLGSTIPTVLGNQAAVPNFAPVQPPQQSSQQMPQQGLIASNNFNTTGSTPSAIPAQTTAIAIGVANPLQACVQSCTLGLSSKSNYAHHCLPMCLAYAPFSANASQMNWQNIGNQAAAFLLQRAQ